MKYGDALKAKKELVNLLRHPEEWPENFEWDWGNPFPNSPDVSKKPGNIRGCAKVLASLSGIIKSPDKQEVMKSLNLTEKEYSAVFLECHPSYRKTTAKFVARLLENV